MRAVVYGRLSAAQDDEVRDSVPQQLKDGKATVERMGWELVAELADRSISAWDGGAGGHGRVKDRPAWTEMLRLAKAGEVDVVVVRHVDRLLRNPRARADLRDTGLRVADQSGNLMDDFALGILSEVATKESDVRSDRQKKAETRRVDAGLPPRGGHRHFGYSRDEHEVVPEEAAILREMADRWLKGETAAALARELNDRGVETTRGNAWSGRSLQKCIQSPRLAGLRVHNGTEHEGSWEPILSRELHARLVAFTSGPTRQPPERYLLTGLLFCGRCGHHLNGKDHQQTAGGRRYSCRGCHRVGISAQATEDHVWNEALARVWDADQDAREDVDARLAEVEAELAGVRASVSELDDLYFKERELSKDRWARQTGALEERANELEAEARHLRGERQKEQGYWSALMRLADTYEEASALDRRRIIERAVARVTVAPTTRGAGRLDLDRLDVEWRE